MRIIRSAAELDTSGAGVLVPTMGALHAGHTALVRKARELAGPGGRVVVSVFVNPTQFNDPGDLERYPRTFEADATLAEAAGATDVYAPDASEVYPPGVDVPVGELPDAATRPRLEDAWRPGHFAGVVQVVRRLFALTRPAAAVFGEKDWQQLQVVRAMSEGERLGVRIEPCAMVREDSGLAFSSRNRFLAKQDRSRALAVRRALLAAGRSANVQEAERAMRGELEAPGATIEYAVVRDASSLLPLPGVLKPTSLRRPARALIALRLGEVRLIDNAPWPFALPE